eukprot:2053972-Pleurochrysis_carterae.AAC.2
MASTSHRASESTPSIKRAALYGKQRKCIGAGVGVGAGAGVGVCPDALAWVRLRTGLAWSGAWVSAFVNGSIGSGARLLVDSVACLPRVHAERRRAATSEEAAVGLVLPQ